MPRSVLLLLPWEAFPTPSPQFSTETLLWRGPGLGSICTTAAASLEPPWALSEDARAHVQPPFPALCFKTLDLVQPVHGRLSDITARPGAACSQPSAPAPRTMASLSALYCCRGLSGVEDSSRTLGILKITSSSPPTPMTTVKSVIMPECSSDPKCT